MAGVAARNFARLFFVGTQIDVVRFRPLPMKTRLRLVLVFFAVSLGDGFAAQPAAPVAPAQDEAPRFVFSLLPKSLQRRPRVDFNVLTTLTPAGKQLAVPSTEQPAYYVLEQGINRNVGVGAEHNLKSPPVEKIKEVLQAALAQSGYRPSDEQHPASLVVIFHWGSSSYNPSEDDGSDELMRRKVLLDRAMLLAGEKFALRVSEAMEQIDRNAGMLPEMAAMVPNPFEQMMNESHQMARLVDELFSSSYFVVASAFDYAAMAKNQPLLLWRTKMTVNSIGVNMTETVPPLIASAAPYFGRDMETPMLVSKQISRDGKVEIGEAKVIEADVRPAPPPAAEKKGATPTQK